MQLGMEGAHSPAATTLGSMPMASTGSMPIRGRDGWNGPSQSLHMPLPGQMTMGGQQLSMGAQQMQMGAQQMPMGAQDQGNYVLYHSGHLRGPDARNA